MDITINETTYPLRFGLKFLREANRAVSKEDELGVKQNVGLRYLIGGILDGDIEDLETCILLANKTEEPKLPQSVLDDFIENPDTDIDWLFGEIKDFLSRANVTKITFKEMVKLLALAEESL